MLARAVVGITIAVALLVFPLALGGCAEPPVDGNANDLGVCHGDEPLCDRDRDYCGAPCIGNYFCTDRTCFEAYTCWCRGGVLDCYTGYPQCDDMAVPLPRDLATRD